MTEHQKGFGVVDTLIAENTQTFNTKFEKMTCLSEILPVVCSVKSNFQTNLELS